MSHHADSSHRTQNNIFASIWWTVQQQIDRRAQYEFNDRWVVDGKLDDVAAILSKPDCLPLWWPQFRSVSVRDPGREHGLGCCFDTRIKGFLPYTLALSFRVDHVRYPHEFSVDIGGDFVGTGGGKLRQVGQSVLVDLSLAIRIIRPSLRYLSVLLRSLMSLQHRIVINASMPTLAAQLSLGEHRND